MFVFFRVYFIHRTVTRESLTTVLPPVNTSVFTRCLLYSPHVEPNLLVESTTQTRQCKGAECQAEITQRYVEVARYHQEIDYDQ